MWKVLKRILLGVLITVLVFSLAACAQFVVLGPLCNDWAADRLRDQFVSRLELQPGETLVETAAWAGNSSGTGDHTELWAGALIFCDGESTQGTPLDRDTPLWDQPGPRTADLEDLFSTLASLEDWDGYYLRETYGHAVTQWDIRGC